MNSKKLLTIAQQTLQSVTRAYGKHNKKYLYKDGVKYGKLMYYPRWVLRKLYFWQPNNKKFRFRTAEHVDPPLDQPVAKMFRVQRIKPVKGNPYWEKRILKDLGLDGKQGEFTVVKNIPENNARLWKVKHLLKIDPITFPYGEPTSNDVKHTIVKENGECLVTKEIGAIAERCEARELFDAQPKRLNTELLKKDARAKWTNPW